MMSRSVVVQHDPRRTQRRRLGLALLGAGLFVLGLWVGAAVSMRAYWQAAEENAELRLAVVEQRNQLEAVRQWRVGSETRQEVDAAALEMVRAELATQQQTIAELERGIRFYKSLMAPGELAEGLNIRGVDIAPGDQPEHYQFRVLVQQSARKHSMMEGTLGVQLLGERDGEAENYELSSLSEDIPQADIRLRFKYFQAVDGELVLPAGFEPAMIRVSARTHSPRRADVVEEFPWAMQEKVGHVGQ